MLELLHIVGVLLRFVWAAMVIVLLVMLVMAMLAGAAGLADGAPVGGSNAEVMQVFCAAGEVVRELRNSLPPVCE